MSRRGDLLWAPSGGRAARIVFAQLIGVCIIPRAARLRSETDSNSLLVLALGSVGVAMYGTALPG